MKRTILCAAIAAAAIAIAAPAQARMADTGLKTATPAATVQQVRWRNHHHSRHHHPRWWNYYAFSPRHRHYTCWNTRVRTWGYHWRWVRQCGWRYY
jgi:hypothetical protein